MEFGDLLVPLLFAFWIYCIFDVIRTPEGKTENLPKVLWLLLVIFLSFIGGLAWLLLGRPRERARIDLRTNLRRQAPPPPPPRSDDDYRRKREDAIRRYNEQRERELRAREAEMQRRVEELRRREQGRADPS